MPANGPFLIAVTLAAIALLLALILGVRLHAFLALLLASMTLGIASGLGPEKTLKSMQSGFGEALGFIAVVVTLGAMIGRFLEYSGGGRALASWLLAKFGRENAVWAMLVTGFLVGLPLFFEVGFIVLIPLLWNLARESKRSLLYFGMPAICALSALHSMAPPHPAPAAAAQLFGADLGKAILYGVAVAIPMALMGGIVYGRWLSKRLFIPVPEIADRAAGPAENGVAPPPIPVVILLLILPVLLILAATIAKLTKSGEAVLGFLGHPFSALLITALMAMVFFGFRRGLNRDQVTKMATDSLAPIGTLLAIMGAGGAFKQVIVDSGVGPYAGQMLASSSISPLIVAFVVSSVMKAAQGSATVAIITAAGIVAPLVKGIPGYTPEMLVLALCAGGTGLSHVNDAGFWIVNEYFGMTVPQTLRSWSVMKIVTSVTGLAVILLAQAVFFG